MLLAAEQVGNTRGAQVSEIVVTHLLADQQYDMIAVHVALPVAQDALGVRADGKALCLGRGDVVRALDGPRRLLQLQFAGGEFFHGRGAYHPCVDAEAGCCRLEQRAAVLDCAQLAPALAENAAVNGGAHMADHIGFHDRGLLSVDTASTAWHWSDNLA